jgi:hypothetical protein
VPRGQRDGSLRPYSQVSRAEPLLFLPCSSSILLTMLMDRVPDPNILTGDFRGFLQSFHANEGTRPFM